MRKSLESDPTPSFFIFTNERLRLHTPVSFPRLRSRYCGQPASCTGYLTVSSSLTVSREVPRGRAALVAQPGTNPPRSRRHEFDPWVGKIPWRRLWQPAPVFLPGESHGEGSLAGCSPRVSRVGQTVPRSTHTPPGALLSLIGPWATRGTGQMSVPRRAGADARACLSGGLRAGWKAPAPSGPQRVGARAAGAGAAGLGSGAAQGAGTASGGETCGVTCGVKAGPVGALAPVHPVSQEQLQCLSGLPSSSDGRTRPLEQWSREEHWAGGDSRLPAGGRRGCLRSG